jgi:hypothetical protein
MNSKKVKKYFCSSEVPAAKEHFGDLNRGVAQSIRSYFHLLS